MVKVTKTLQSLITVVVNHSIEATKKLAILREKDIESQTKLDKNRHELDEHNVTTNSLLNEISTQKENNTKLQEELNQANSKAGTYP